MRKYGFSALVAAGLLAGGLTASSASAADLGGNCCADLEERIAELEATTARKGNRKVSLTISGWVGQQITAWDYDAGGKGEGGDGLDASGVYVHDLGTTLGTHFKMTGAAQISPGWSAGYVLHIEAIGSDGLTHSQQQPEGPALYIQLAEKADENTYTWGRGVQVLQSFWFIKSDHLGKVSVGLQSQASDNTAILVDGSGSLVPANWVAFDYRAFATSAGGLLGLPSCGAMGGAVGDCNGLTTNSVRYDSPTWGGFSVSAGWGEDSFWDVAARYAGEWAGFKVAAAAAYNDVDDPNWINRGQEADYFQAGVYVQHIGSGIWGLVNYGDYDPTGGLSVETWYFKAGLRRRWHPLGHTVLYGEYEFIDDNAYGFSDGDFRLYGVGIVQEIDAAAMSIWLKYRNVEADFGKNAAGAGSSCEYGVSCKDDFEYVGLGALINF